MRRCLALVDTSALLLVAFNEASLDDLRESLEGCEPAVTEAVVHELETISKGSKLKRAKAAKWVLENVVSTFTTVCRNVLTSRGLGTDEMIIECALSLMAKGLEVLIITADVGLRRRATSKGIAVLFYHASERLFERL